MRIIGACLMIIGVLLATVYSPTDAERDERHYTVEELQAKMAEWSEYVLENEAEMTEFARNLLKNKQLSRQRIFFSEEGNLYYSIDTNGPEKEYYYVEDVSIPETVYEIKFEDVYIDQFSSYVEFNYVMAQMLPNEEAVWGELKLLYIQKDAYSNLHESWKDGIIYSDQKEEYAWLCVFSDLP